ncbi:uncharacterized protein [Nicotiana tomentosiformis]|uniref:uncharacterized protein n=1 Tax=Nicotiana tomentosiformis TaxID=4098 RepID=UPI00388CC72F
MNGSRILYLHRQIATLTQGISSVLIYFSKLKELWAEFDVLIPCPDCGCEESKKYVKHFESQRLLQFLMGQNESYAQSNNQIMVMSPTSSINKANAMIISEKNRRSLALPKHVSKVNEGIVLFSNNRGYRAGNSSSPGSTAKFSSK